MAIKRITISVPEETAARIKKAAVGMPVSAWVTEVVEDRLDDREMDRLWREFYQAVKPRGGDIHRADELFERLTARRPRRAA